MSIRKSITLALAGCATLVVAAPAAAQNVVYADPVRAITDTNAIANGFQSVQNTYKSNIDTFVAREKEVRDLSQTLASLDKNGDGSVTPEETASANASQKATLTQIETKNKEIAALQAPIYKAQLYVVDQIAKNYEAAEKSVVDAKKISMVLDPSAVVWAPESANITDDITAKLNQTVAAVNIVAPDDWKPTQATLGLHEQISKILNMRQYVAAVRASQQAQAAEGAQGGTAPATSQPDSR